MKATSCILIIFIFIGDTKQTSDVTLFLERSYRPYDTTELTKDNIDIVDRSKPIKVIIHGWMSSISDVIITEISYKYLAKEPQNVILVDWSRISNQSYFEATTNIPLIGDKITEILISLHGLHPTALDNMHVIALSLGAHLAGHVGREVFRSTGHKIPRITALDPGGPLFDEGNFIEQDAFKPLVLVDFSSIDFTNPVEISSFKLPPLEAVAGVVDMYKADPLTRDDAACSLGAPSVPQKRISCSHFKSVEYFLNSIEDVLYVGTQCESWDKFKSGVCDQNGTAFMGDPFMDSEKTSGVFFLYT